MSTLQYLPQLGVVCGLLVGIAVIEYIQRQRKARVIAQRLRRIRCGVAP